MSNEFNDLQSEIDRKLEEQKSAKGKRRKDGEKKKFFFFFSLRIIEGPLERRKLPKFSSFQ